MIFPFQTLNHTMSDWICVEQFSIPHASVGILPHEYQQKQPLIFDVFIALDLKKAGQSGELQDTIDYRTITATIEHIIDSQHYPLIESLGHAVLQSLSQQIHIEKITLRIHKPKAMPNCRASIIMHWQRP